MSTILKIGYHHLRLIFHKLKFYSSVNWTKTLYFNFKKFPLATAKKLPVVFYGKVKFSSIAGEIKIDAPIRRGMIGFGQNYEMNTVSSGTAEINITGKLIFNGPFQFGKDYFVFVGKSGYCELGKMASLGSLSKLICIEKIVLGNYARFGAASNLVDTNFHHLKNTQTGEVSKMTKSVRIGNYTYAGDGVSIMPGTFTPDYCTIASRSLCNKDFSSLEQNCLLAGMPAKLVKTHIARDWEGEREALDAFLTVW